MESETSLKKSVQREVERRIKAGKCLACGRESGELRRGLCVTHYHQYRRRLLSLPAEDRSAFEQKVTKAGKILPRNKVWSIKRDDPFAGF
jgi:hypothetical protein